MNYELPHPHVAPGTDLLGAVGNEEKTDRCRGAEKLGFCHLGSNGEATATQKLCQVFVIYS